jgi:salicylate hydroxylase
VVGDAAHVMVPAHAAGASIAIESAVSLEVIFRGLQGRDSKTMRNRLDLFDKIAHSSMQPHHADIQR